MKNGYILASICEMHEKIYLKDILSIQKTSLDRCMFFIEINYISDFYRDDPNPVFWIKEIYDSEKKRNIRYEALKKRLNKVWKAHPEQRKINNAILERAKEQAL